MNPDNITQEDMAKIQRRLGDYTKPLKMDRAIRAHVNLKESPFPLPRFQGRPPGAPAALAVVLMRRAASAAAHRVNEANLQREIVESDRSADLNNLMKSASATEQALDGVFDALVDTKQFDGAFAGNPDAGSAWIDRLVASYIASGSATDTLIGPPRSPAMQIRKARDDIETLLCAKAILAAIHTGEGSIVAANERAVRKPAYRPASGGERAFVRVFAEAWTYCMGEWPSSSLKTEGSSFLRFVQVAWWDLFLKEAKLTGAVKVLDRPSDYLIQTMVKKPPPWNDF